MKFNSKVLRFQEGGPMPAEDPAMAQGGAPEGAPMGPEGAPAGPEGPEAQLQQLAGQLVEMLMQQIGDPRAVMAVLQMAAEMVGQAAQGGEPAYQRQGGRLVRVR